MSTFEPKLNSKNSLAVQGALVNRLQRCTDLKTQNGLRFLERVKPWVHERSEHLSLNKFLDWSIPSMRNEDDGEKERKKRMVKIAVN